MMQKLSISVMYTMLLRLIDHTGVAWPDEEVLQYIREQSGHMFAPELN